MSNIAVFTDLIEVWCHSDDELVDFSERFSELFAKYFLDIKLTSNVCTDKVLDNVLKHTYGYDMEALMNIIHFVKVSQMNTGAFMQEMLGSFPGWESLGVGHETGLDLYNKSRKIYVELKNRYNTDNASAKAKNFEKLAVQKRNGFRAVYGIVNDKTTEGIKKDITFNDVTIEYISSDMLFAEITGIKNFSDVLSKLIAKLSSVNKT